MHRQQRLTPLRHFLRRGCVNRGFTGLGDGLHRLGTLALGKRVVHSGGVGKCGFQTGANLGGQSVPEPLVDDHCKAHITMLGHGEMLLHLVHLLGIKIQRRVFSAIHHTGLQGLRHLGKRHHLRKRAKGAHLLVNDFGSLYAHFQAAHIGGYANRAIGRHHLETHVPISETPNALGFQNAEQPLPDRPVHHTSQRRPVFKQKRQIKDFEFAYAQRTEFGQGRCQHLHRAHLQRLQFFLVFIECAVGIDIHPHLASGVALGKLLEMLDGLALGRAHGGHVAELDDDLLVDCERRHTQRQQSQNER